MLSSKTFVKKTRSGSVLKVVREHYLRDDIACGVQRCVACKGIYSKEAKSTEVLEPNPASIAKVCAFSHYLVPDTNVALHQLDFLEDEYIRNVVILQTVLNEVKHQNLSAYKRFVKTYCIYTTLAHAVTVTSSRFLFCFRLLCINKVSNCKDLLLLVILPVCVSCS